jgi:hypothetical protein
VKNVHHAHLNARHVTKMDALFVPKTELTHQNAHANQEPSKMPMVNVHLVQRNARLVFLKTNVLFAQPTELTHHTVSAQQVLLITVKPNVHLVMTNATLVTRKDVLFVLKDISTHQTVFLHHQQLNLP